MKSGMSLSEMAKELERQAAAKRDFISPTTELEMELSASGPGGNPMMRVNGHGSFEINDIGHDQIAGKLNIPKKYYDRLREDAPELLRENVNHWFQKEPDRMMVRTLDGNMRSLLSSSYRPIDNQGVANAAFGTLRRLPGLRIESTQLTERRMYIKAVTERITFEVKKGDVVQAGIVISNSEVGMGSVRVEPMIFRLVCLNGMIAADASLRKYHVGREFQGDDAMELLRDETREADDKAFFMKVQDIVRGAFNRDVFERLAGKMTAALADHIDPKADLGKVVEVTQAKLGLQEGERNSVLSYLIKGGDLTRYGLLNAITRTSQDVESYDRATELEKMGGTVLEMPKQEWDRIAVAA